MKRTRIAMQYYALDKGQLIHVKDAERKKDYTCPECLKTIRYRQGPLRIAHFYHPHSSLCALSSKGEIHIAIQEKIHRELPGSIMEHPFPNIQRIADIYWPKQKLVIEVQCSPISLPEARSRVENYEREGLKIIWILHIKKFNRRRVSQAEKFLRSRCCYFTDINAQGEGVIFDQWDQIHGFYRTKRSPPIKIEISKPLPISNLEKLPQELQKKIKNTSIYFSGDIIDRQLQRGWKNYFNHPEQPFHWKAILSKIQRGYLILFRILAEITVGSKAA